MTDVRKLGEELLTAVGEKARVDGEIAALRRLIHDEAERRLQSDGMAPTWKNPALGVIRFDMGAWSPMVQDTAAFTSWLAQRNPDDVVATITVPAGALAKIVDALTDSGIQVTAKVEAREASAKAILAAAVPSQVDDSGDPTESAEAVVDGEFVDGVRYFKGHNRLVVTFNSQRKKAIELAAVEQVRGRYAPAVTDVQP